MLWLTTKTTEQWNNGRKHERQTASQEIGLLTSEGNIPSFILITHMSKLTFYATRNNKTQEERIHIGTPQYIRDMTRTKDQIIRMMDLDFDFPKQTLEDLINLDQHELYNVLMEYKEQNPHKVERPQ